MENLIEYFDFIADPKFKSLLIRDFHELQNCVKYESSKSVLILSGSIIEATLLEFFTHNLPSGTTESKLLKLNLSELIIEAESIGLISSKSKELSTVIKNYRNLIHPGREIRTKEEFDFDTAIVSFSLVKMILKEIKENYIQKYGYRAEDIFNKIIVDTSTFSIYEKLLLKLNNHEKIRLANMLVDYQLEHYQEKQKTKYNRYINPLKSQIGIDNLTSFCKELLKQVEKGKEYHILALFEIFGNDLELLNTEEQELVMTYIYNIVNSISPWNDKIENSELMELFPFLGRYLGTSFLKQKFFDLLVKIVKYHNSAEKNKWAFVTAYRGMISNFSKDKVEKCDEYIKENTSKEVSEGFFLALVAYDDLPF